MLVVLTVRLMVDRRGLLVGFGPWGWPRLTVPLREIEYAVVSTVRPSEWGGWGYRMRRGGPGDGGRPDHTLIDREARRPG
jgi:hypothetical protein